MDRTAAAELEALLASLELAVPSGELADESLRRRVVDLRSVIDRLEACFAEAAHTLEVRGIPSAEACVDAPAWLVGHASMSRSAARVATRLGAGMACAPSVSEALHAGDISPEAARLVLGARNPRTAEAWDRDQAQLVSWARSHRPDQLRVVLRHWAAAADPDGVDPATDRARNEVTVAMVAGRGVVRGDLDAESAAVVNQALVDMVDELWRAAGDEARGTHSAAWWRAEALCEIVRRSRAVTDADSARAARPLVSVVVDYDALRRPQGRLVGLPTGELIQAEAVRRLACDAGVARVVMKGSSRPLEAGRAHRTPSATQYRAVLARDRGCGIADCHAPPWLCEVHHRRHWADGGPTDVDNLVMVCRRHHRLAHEGGFAVQDRPDEGYHLVRRCSAAAA